MKLRCLVVVEVANKGREVDWSVAGDVNRPDIRRNESAVEREEGRKMSEMVSDFLSDKTHVI